MNNDDIFDLHGVEIKFSNPENFLKIKETLTRLGIPSYKDGQVLYQSCHILHKRGRYVIIHFKEMFALDGKQTSLSEEDIARRNSIVKLLLDWKLCELAEDIDLSATGVSRIKIIKHSEKSKWRLESKYSIGIKH